MFSEGAGADTLESIAFSIDQLSTGPSDILDEIERYTTAFSDPRALEVGVSSLGGCGLGSSGAGGSSGSGGSGCLDDSVVLDAAVHLDLAADESYYPVLQSWEGINDMFSSPDLPWSRSLP